MGDCCDVLDSVRTLLELGEQLLLMPSFPSEAIIILNLGSSISGTRHSIAPGSSKSFITTRASKIFNQAEPPPALMIFLSFSRTSILPLNRLAGPSTTRVSNSPPSPRTAPSPSVPNLFIALSMRPLTCGLATFCHRKLSSRPPLATLTIRASRATECMSSSSEVGAPGVRVGYCHR